MKGQSAVEYVMTYGWAMLALIIVTGFLLASGILNPNYVITEECNLGSNLPCEFMIFNEEGSTKLLLQVYNGFPYKIRINSIEVILKDTGESFSDFDRNVLIDSGANHTYESELPGPELQVGEVKRFSVQVTYVSCAPEVRTETSECSSSNHTISGKIVGMVNEG
jgi:hypothetical protein